MVEKQRLDEEKSRMESNLENCIQLCSRTKKDCESNFVNFAHLEAWGTLAVLSAPTRFDSLVIIVLTNKFA